MRRAFRQVAAGFVGGVLAGVVLFPAMIALAEERAEDLQPSDEAFFLRHRDPLEPVPPGGGVGLPDDATEIPRATVRDRTNPYGTETIHVGLNAGQEEAIAYIGLTGTRDELGFTVEITGGEIRLPISGFGQSNRNPEGADMVACLATDLVVDAHGGSWDSQYEFDCGTLAEVVLEEGSDPLTWVIDLAPFVPAWQDFTVPPGIAIVANPETEQSPPEQTWHVSWQNRHYLPADDDDPDPRPITVALSYIEDEDAFPDFGDPDDATATTTGQDFAAPPPATGPTQQFGAQTGFVPPTETPDFAGDADAEFAPPEEMDEDEAVAAPPGADFDPAAIRTNPAVYLLPFLAVGLAGLVGYSLTSEPVLPHAREGAVTNLMRRRRAAAAAAAGADNV